jgi:hypothetical protein
LLQFLPLEGLSILESISSNFGKKRMAKSHLQIVASQVTQIFSASTSPNFIQKCFVKWLFSFFVIRVKKP